MQAAHHPTILYRQTPTPNLTTSTYHNLPIFRFRQKKTPLLTTMTPPQSHQRQNLPLSLRPRPRKPPLVLTMTHHHHPTSHFCQMKTPPTKTTTHLPSHIIHIVTTLYHGFQTMVVTLVHQSIDKLPIHISHHVRHQFPSPSDSSSYLSSISPIDDSPPTITLSTPPK